jgi:hypothetical protein
MNSNSTDYLVRVRKPNNPFTITTSFTDKGEAIGFARMAAHSGYTVSVAEKNVTYSEIYWEVE